jgi:predicted amino acid racemase
MAYLTLDHHKLEKNYQYLNSLFQQHGIHWSVVTKLLCGNETFLKAVLRLGLTQVCDSRLRHLRIIKSLAPHVQTIFIKPPAAGTTASIVQYADVSFNSSLRTIRALSAAAGARGKRHKIVIMVETGELREGVMPADLPAFFEAIYQLPGIEVIGLGTNLTCMYGVLPSYENLQELQRCRQTLESRFGVDLPLLSGGASVTIPLVGSEALPPGINHFRVGESLFFGTDVYHSDVLEAMEQNLFSLYAEVIELREKPVVPLGELGCNLAGERKTFDPAARHRRSVRAIVDVGLLDIDPKHVTPVDGTVKIAGTSSDMMVLNLGDNEAGYRVGDKIQFELDYMGVLRAMHSPYIDKRVGVAKAEAGIPALATLAP